MKGYKGFGPGLICKGKQYQENTVFEEPEEKICEKGMHFCENPFDVLDYYDLIRSDGTPNEFAEVEALDEPKTDDKKKFCSRKLKIGVKLGLSGFIKACVDFVLEKTIAEAPSENVDSGQFARIGWEARRFFLQLLSSGVERIAVENPCPLQWFNLPEYSQIIEPYMFGDPWKKRTCLWLRNLPLLAPTNIVEPDGLWVGSTSGREHSTGRVKSGYTLKSSRDSKTRAKTFPGIAAAMAEQWGSQEEQ